MRQLRQPRLADIVAARLRDDILTGKLGEGDSLPRQESLVAEFRVSLPAVREAMRILETEGLVSVRRGNVGGAVVHLPTPERTAQMISMVLQTRQTTPSDVGTALQHLEPLCAGLCAAREDRHTEVVPHLRAVIDDQTNGFDDLSSWNRNARRFHEAIVEHCGSQTMIVVIGSLETIWSAHESSVWDSPREMGDPDDPHSPLSRKVRRSALRGHEKILTAVERGDTAQAVALAGSHLLATQQTTLASSQHETVNANLVGGIDLQFWR